MFQENGRIQKIETGVSYEKIDKKHYSQGICYIEVKFSHTSKQYKVVKEHIC